jgi:hypothetical protein
MDLFVLSLLALAGLIFGFAAAIFCTGFHRAAGLSLILATLPVVLGFAFFFEACSGDACDTTWLGFWAAVIEVTVIALLILSGLFALIGLKRGFTRRRSHRAEV